MNQSSVEPGETALGDHAMAVVFRPSMKNANDVIDLEVCGRV